MMERLFEQVIAVAAIAAASALAVFAAGFALYALMLHWLPPAGAAAVVAGFAALFATGVAAFVRGRGERRKLMEEVARVRGLKSASPEDIAGWLGEHPLVTLAVSALGGFLATRHPTLAGEIIAALRGGRRDRGSNET